MKIFLIISIIYLIFSIIIVKSQFTNTGFPIKVLSSTSPWNTLIDNNNAIVDTQSVSMINRIKDVLASNQISVSLGLHYAQWTAPLYLVDTSINNINRITIYQGQNEAYHETVDPKSTGMIKNLPVLTTFTPDPKADGHMIVFDINLKVFHEFSRFAWINSTSANATRYNTFSYDDNGTYYPMAASTRWWMYGVRGSGSNFIAGLIRYDEIERGDLNHAIAFGGPINRLKTSSSNSWNIELCSPVSCRSDGYVIGEDTIMEGQRIQLNPNYDISKLPPKSKLVAQALQKYGGYIVDNSGDFGIYFENKGPAETSPWISNYGTDLSSLNNIPLDEFRVLACSNIVTGPTIPPNNTTTTLSTTTTSTTSSITTSSSTMTSTTASSTSNPTTTTTSSTTTTTTTSSTSSTPTQIPDDEQQPSKAYKTLLAFPYITFVIFLLSWLFI